MLGLTVHITRVIVLLVTEYIYVLAMKITKFMARLLNVAIRPVTYWARLAQPLSQLNEQFLNVVQKIVIHYDYAGIEKWATGEWKRNIPLTQAYHEDVNDLMKSIDVTFQHVKAHSGDENNNRADRLAKQGCGLK